VASLDRKHIYCNNEQVTFIDTLYGRQADRWTWEIFNTWDSTLFNTSHRIAIAAQDANMPTPYQYSYVFGASGYFTVRMIKYKKGDCIEYDTSYLRLKIGDNPAFLKVGVHKLRPCNSYKYEFVNNSSNADNLPFSDTAFVWNFGDGTPEVIAKKDTVITHQFPGEGNYTINLTLQDTASFCNAPLDTSIVISISNQLQAIIQAPDTLCIPNTFLLGNASRGGTNFVWVITTPQGVTDSFPMSDLSQLPYNFNESGDYRIELYAKDTVCGTDDYAVDTVFAYPLPTAGFTFSPDNATNQVITFTNTSTSNFGQVDDQLQYIWYFGDGTTSTEKNPQHLFTQTGAYLVQLVAYNNGGCADTASAEVTETIVPKLDMPNAFTPNGDGHNDHFGPRAFGISQIDFRIYNRWGQLVYQSADPEVAYMQNKGWDGTFKNQAQPMDVYAYILHVIFMDGTKATKQGSVTLVR
jgi:gliding motility-associated-like protein